MLGGIAAMVGAAKAVLDQGKPLKGNLHIESVPGEESNKGHLGTSACIERGYRAPFAIIGEPTKGEIQPVTCGTFMFDITVPGKDIHTSMKNLTMFSGFNAVCDATLFGRAGIPAIIFGPGDLSTGVHGPDERIEIQDLLDCCKAYAAMAVDWCELA